MNQPSLNSDLVFKRYNRSDCVEFPVITGFSLFTITSNGSLLPSNVMLEGRNLIKKLAFGKNEQEDVCYINNGVHNHNVCMEIAVNEGGADKLYTANFVIGFKFHRSNMELLLNEQAHLYELTVEQFLKNTLLKEELKVSLTGLKTDRANTNADIQGYLSSKAKNILDEHNATLTNFSIICEEKRDHELQIAEQNYNRFIFEKELKEKLLEAESQAERDGIARHYELEAHKKIQSGEFNKKVILVDESVDTQKIESSLRLELLQIEGEAKVKQANHVNYLIDIQSKEEATLRELKAKKNTKVTEIKTDDDIDEAEHHSRLNRVNRHGEMLSQLEKSFPSSNAEPESAESNLNTVLNNEKIDFDRFPKALKRFSEVVNFPNADGPLCRSSEFGEYFWKKLIDDCGELNFLLKNEKLHYIRYEDNYCNTIDQVAFLYQILKHLKHFDCYSKAFSETHLIFGYNRETKRGQLKPWGRNKLCDELFKKDGHLSTSIKSKLHDRELALVFNNEAKIRIKLTFGLGFWMTKKVETPKDLIDTMQAPVDFKDVTPQLVESVKEIDIPVYNQVHEKDTTASIWGYFPFDSNKL